MNIVRVEQNEDPSKYIIVTQQSDINETVTNRVFVTENINRAVNVVEIARGIPGFTGPPGKDGVVFDILPIISGGTNNNTFSTNKVIYYDGTKLVSSNYNIEDIITGGVLAGTGVIVVSSGNSIIVNSNLGSGLYVNNNNQIVVDFNAIDQRVLQYINITAGSGLTYSNSSFHIGQSADILVNSGNIELRPTGIAGTYTKIVTDNKGRVTSGTNLTNNDVVTALGYTPWHPGNDGSNSELDADKLDSFHASYFLNAQNLTGILSDNIFPKYINQGSYTKVYFSDNSVITGVSNNIYNEIISSLGYRPVSTTGDNISGNLIVNNHILAVNDFKISDNLPTIAINHSELAWNDPRGFRFLYGTNPNSPKTGILAYYPGPKNLRLITDASEIILTDKLAATIYASFTGLNTFSGINNFIDTINASMINVSGININTTGLINNLNADYLDFKHGSFYLNASNLTGTLNASGYPVNIANISGSINYIPKFNNLTADPSRTISDSIISELANSILVNNGNLIVGINNSTISNITENSLVVGSENILKDVISSVALGSGHLVSGDYSFAANYGNEIRHDFSSVFGKQGQTWADNQHVFGLFQEPSGINSGQGKGQYSTIGFHYYGQASSYNLMVPSFVFIPKNKAFLYNFDVLITRLGASGCAAFKFESGIVRNLTRRSPSNLAIDENITIQVKDPVKYVVHNDSYIRDYPLFLESDDEISDTTIKVVDVPASTETSYVDIQNLKQNIILNYKPISVTGNFYSDQSSDNIILNLDKPKTTGYFIQQETENNITLYTYDHKVVSGTEIDVEFITNSRNGYIPPNTKYIVSSIIDNNICSVQIPPETGIISGLISGPGSAMRIMIDDAIYNYDNIETIHIKYINGNNITYSDFYSTTNRLSDKYTYDGYTIFEIDDADPDLLALLDYDYSYGRVEVTPASSNSGVCLITPKRQMSGTFTQNPNLSRYKAFKTEFTQSASDQNGYSVISFSGLDPDFSNSYYNSWVDVSGQLFDAKNTYIEFAKYIDSTYVTTGSYYGSGVGGIVVPVPFSEIRGFHNIGNITNFDREAILLIDTINTVAVGQYVSTSGGSFSYFQEIFIPYSTGNIASSGRVRLIESGSYFSGHHPYNGKFNLSSLDVDNKIFEINIKYINPASGYAISGYADIYTQSKDAQIDISNISPEFNRNVLGEKCYLNFNNNIIDDNFTIVSNTSPANKRSFYVIKKYFYPEYPLAINGSVNICANRDHAMVQDSDDFYGLSPIVFEDIKNHPKNAIYKIININGDTITLDNSKQHIRNEVNKPMYIGNHLSTGSGCYGLIDLIDSSNFSIPGLAFADNLSKQELSEGDIIEVKNFETLGYLGYYLVSGTVNDGGAGQKFAIPLSGVGNELQVAFPEYMPTGTMVNILYSKVSSGNCYIPQNNIFWNTEIGYENLYNRWRFNNSGTQIYSPKLVSYFIDAYSSTCEPQKACIVMSGNFNDAILNEQDEIYISFDRPNEFLNRSYLVSKNLQNTGIYCNPRVDSLANYQSIVFPISGFAEVIPYHTINNLVSKNPNQNNVIYEPAITWLQESGSYYSNDLSQITGHHAQYFDDRTKKQFHSLEIKLNPEIDNNRFKISGNIPSLENPYLVKMSRYIGGSDSNSDKSFNFVVNSIKPIEISSLSWKYTNISDGWTYTTGINDYVALNNDILEIFTDVDWSLRILTKHGTYSSGHKPVAPAVEIFGIKNYTVSNLQFNYIDNTYQDGYWTIDINCEKIKYITDKNISVSVQDYSGKYEKNIRLKTNERLQLKNVLNNTLYSQPDTPWYSLLNIYGVPATGVTNLSVYVDSFAGAIDLYAWESDISGFSFLMSGLSPSSEQQTNIGFTAEYLGQKINQSGIVETTNSVPVSFKTYNFDQNPIIFQPTCNSYIIPIIVPNLNNNINNLNINITGITTTTVSIGYSEFLKRYLIKAYINTNSEFGLHPCSFGFTYNSTSTTINKNIVVADYLKVLKSELYEPIPIFKNRLWDIEFNINGGIGTKNNTYTSSIKLGNTPKIGHYDINESTDQYELIGPVIGDSYNNTTSLHRIYITGNKRPFDNSYFENTGIYNLKIYLDDGYSSYTDSISLQVLDVPSINNLTKNIYSNFNQSAKISTETFLSDEIGKNNSSKLDGSITTTTKYDPIQNLYRHRSNTAPITNIWDARLLFQDIQYPVPSDISQTRVAAQCKGIIDDKIYAVGKLSMLEVSNSYINVPIKISNLSRPINVNGGEPWSMSFNVCYGLADQNYPPLITISGTPTSCSGLSTNIDNAPSCFKTRRFDTASKCWYFEFEGEPLCNPLSQFYEITVRARDTVDGITILGSDTANTTFLYGPLPDHPPPIISIQPLEGGAEIYPNCSYVQYLWSGAAQVRSLCPIFTGLSGITFIGNLPSGLNLSISEILLSDGTRLPAFNGGNYIYTGGFGSTNFGYGKYESFLFNNPNISGAIGSIQGTPSAFFSGTFTISGFAIDFRGIDSVTNYSFTDSSAPLSRPMQYTTVYFDKPDYVEFNNSQGEFFPLDGAVVLAPPSNLDGFVYSGVFPDINAPFSGQYFLSDLENQIVTISGINRSISNLQGIIFAQFDDQPSSTSKSYSIIDSSNNSNNRWIRIYSTEISTSFANRKACSFIIPQQSSQGFANFGSPAPSLTIDQNTNGKLLGAGIYADNKLTGYIRPSYKAFLVNQNGTTLYPENEVSLLNFHSGLSIEPIPGICCDHGQNFLIFKNCYESGIAKISGVIVPKPEIEVTDPPTVPVYKNQRLELGIRLAYGFTNNERNFPVNNRSTNGSSGLFYLITNDQDYPLSQLSVQNNVLSYTHNENILTSGAIIRLNLYREADDFPTVDQYAIPEVSNIYHWIYGYYTFDNEIRTIPVDEDPFPPYVPINFDSRIHLNSGQPINVTGNLIGGFIPSNQNVASDPSKTPLMNFSYSGYRPIHTGILSQPLFRSYSGYYYTETANNPTSVLIRLIDGDITGIYSANNIISLENTIFGSTGINILSTGLYNNFVVVSGNNNKLPASNVDGYCSITKCINYEKFGQQIKISPKYPELSTNDRINILPLYSGARLSQSLLSATGNMIIVSGDNSYWYAAPNNLSLLSSYPNSGYALPYKIISGIITTNIGLLSEQQGLWRMTLSGVNTSTLNKDYKYQIMTIDNTGLPTATGLNWPLKQFDKTYDLHIVQPYELYYDPTGPKIESTLVVDQPPNSMSWSSTFYISNGIRPLIENPPLIEINNSLYGFSYTIVYNDYYDMFKVDLSSSLPLSISQIPCLKISNIYGYKEYNIVS